MIAITEDSLDYPAAQPRIHGPYPTREVARLRLVQMLSDRAATHMRVWKNTPANVPMLQRDRELALQRAKSLHAAALTVGTRNSITADNRVWRITERP